MLPSSSGQLETLTYDYNIRGWMLGTNRTYAKDSNSTTNHFGFELSYDKDDLVVHGQNASYGDSLFNGNILGMLWKSGGITIYVDMGLLMMPLTDLLMPNSGNLPVPASTSMRV
ncbi:hypothetical protein [Paraflavitalea speifideaquila]|uniref:hypothetical protein n=1 Tax=Paraflavitalea speifideaquila TaxID=3076558 RepID=UPI0028F0AFE9|nr:hypothetical protein [Paraflavitalea speifideiaquila]